MTGYDDPLTSEPKNVSLFVERAPTEQLLACSKLFSDFEDDSPAVQR